MSMKLHNEQLINYVDSNKRTTVYLPEIIKLNRPTSDIRFILNKLSVL